VEDIHHENRYNQPTKILVLLHRQGIIFVRKQAQKERPYGLEFFV
jgi:hypothetical protein